MAFNHYAKIKRILAEYENNWYVVRFNAPTTAKNFKGETITYDYYYRVFDMNQLPIKYCKFQKFDLLLKTLGLEEGQIVVVDSAD